MIYTGTEPTLVTLLGEARARRIPVTPRVQAKLRQVLKRHPSTWRSAIARDPELMGIAPLVIKAAQIAAKIGGKLVKVIAKKVKAKKAAKKAKSAAKKAAAALSPTVTPTTANQAALQKVTASAPPTVTAPAAPGAAPMVTQAPRGGIPPIALAAAAGLAALFLL